MFWKKKDMNEQDVKNEQQQQNDVSGSDNLNNGQQPHNTEEVSAVNDSTENNADDSAETSPTPEELMKQEIDQLNDKYIRLFAEFDNYKRRTAKERLDLMGSANKETVVSMLPVLDDFERAFKAFENANDVTALKEGVELIFTKFKNIMVSKGVKPIESIGQPFNIDFHEAITNIPAPSEELKGKVIDEVEKGYFLNDKVVRFAKVVVGE
ncbi:MAG: nucleotide exchange factor GrpE [Bacteroidia bacterium]|nr:nucleotide exchange factor GrpE [Bacteroidia bacterium]MBP7261292.1 nucleotide exchange factor GrpE [Bacteroidia bacterium]MBP9180745.1 nucleotide exchange factor GrpE [Bacteroidia bacterium]MBP9725005.1 nucleotide exchange factor GrpE [Bacteroidia bacterium]